MSITQKNAREVMRHVAAGQYEETAAGLVLPKMKARISGKYAHFVNGEYAGEDHNLLPTQGLNTILDIAVGGTAKVSAWYIALFGASVTPAATWTAANFASLASEITSTSEGSSQSTRPVYVPGATVAGVVDNSASRAVFNIVSSSSIIVRGAAVLSSSVRGGTSGILLSASLFDVARTFVNGDIYESQYAIELDPL